MNLIEANTKAHEVLAQYNVPNTTIEWDNTRSRAGVCVHYRSGKKVIKFSRVAFRAMPEAEQIDTILHEIAHARLPHSVGHGPEWQAVHRSMGGNGRKVLHNVEIARAVAKWHGQCRVERKVLMASNRLTEGQRRRICLCHRETLLWVPND